MNGRREHERCRRLATALEDIGVEALLVTNEDSIRYLSGFAGHAANALVGPHCRILITDYRYAEHALEHCSHFEVVVRDRATTSLGRQLAGIFQRLELRGVAFEPETMTVAKLDEVRHCAPNVELLACSGVVERLRYVKDQREIAYLRRAVEIAEDALEQVVATVRIGTSEREIAGELERALQSRGSEGTAFPTIVLSGPRTSMPHGAPSRRRIGPGDLLLVDFGAVVCGYRSDITRTFVVGEPDAEQLEVYDVVFRAQRAGLEAVRANVVGDVPYHAARAVLDASPYAGYAGEGLGHGLGLFLHESPFLDARCRDRLEQGCVVTIEPGIYIPGRAGIRLEDDVLVTADGYRRLGRAPATTLPRIA